VAVPARRGGVLALIAATALAGVLFIALDAGGSADAASKRGPSQTRFLLRLTDLPPGFYVLPIGSIGAEGSSAGPDMPCGRIEPPDPVPPLAAFISRRAPFGCFAAYARLYRAPVPGPAPLLAGTGALDAGSVEAAREGFAVAPELLSHLTFDEIPERLESPPVIGEESMQLRWEDPGLLRRQEVGSLVVWRSGTVLGVVLATARGAAAADRDAVALAHLQQPHLEHPTPYTALEADDSETALDNPGLKRPVLWLGRSFSPGHGLPRLRLEGAFALPGAGNGARQRAILGYRYGTSRKRWTQVSLNVWTEEDWSRRRGGRPRSAAPAARRCAHARRVDLRRGSAVLVGAYRRLGKSGPCPQRPPDVYRARAFIGRSVVAVELLDVCATCARPGVGPYNSLKGMRSIVRGLRVRPQSDF
jgi:hypothetical protein